MSNSSSYLTITDSPVVPLSGWQCSLPPGNGFSRQWMSWLFPWQREVHSIPFLLYCLRLLSKMAFQSSAQDSSLLRGACSWTCLLWQQVNRTCSQLGFSSAPEEGKGGKLESSGGWFPPQLAASNANAFQTSNGIIVIKQQVSRYDGLISG